MQIFLNRKGKVSLTLLPPNSGVFWVIISRLLVLKPQSTSWWTLDVRIFLSARWKTGLGSDIALMPCPLSLPQNCHGVITKACGSGTMALLNPVKQNSGSLWLLFFSIPVLRRRWHVVYSNRSSLPSFQLVSNVPFII